LTVIPDGRGYAEHSAQHRVNIRRSCDMPFGRNRAHPPPHIARGAERTPRTQVALKNSSQKVTWGRYERIRGSPLYSFTLRPGVACDWACPVSAADTMVRGHPSARLANALCASSSFSPRLSPARPSLPCLLLPCTADRLTAPLCLRACVVVRRGCAPGRPRDRLRYPPQMCRPFPRPSPMVGSLIS